MGVRDIDVSLITEAVKKLYIETNYYLGEDVKACLSRCAAMEETEPAHSVFESIEKNIKIAEEGVFPLCQDTGMACVFLEIGQDVHFTGGDLNDAVNAGVRDGCLEGYLRQTIVADPFRRINTGDSTPADVNVEIVPGNKVKVIVAPKGFGSENMSAIKMLPPAAGVQGAEDFIVETVKAAGANPCPPVVVGVGIGGNFSKAALMAKKALLRPIGSIEDVCEVGGEAGYGRDGAGICGEEGVCGEGICGEDICSGGICDEGICGVGICDEGICGEEAVCGGRDGYKGGRNPDVFYAEMERRLLDRINGLNIGPQGFGGRTTALAVNIIAAPTHIAGLPVAVNINCHVSRHGEVVL